MARLDFQRRKKGSTAVFLTAILLSFLLILGSLTEAAGGKASRSYADAVLNLAAESVLAEYDRKLLEDYGLFAFRMNEEQVALTVETYGEASFKKDRGYGNLLRLSIEDVSADLTESGLLAPSLLEAQILAYMQGRILLDATEILGLADKLQGLPELLSLVEETSALADRFQSAKQSLEDAASADPEEEGAGEALAAAEEDYQQAMDEALSSVGRLESLSQNMEGSLGEGLAELSPEGETPEPGFGSEAGTELRTLKHQGALSALPSREMELSGFGFDLSGPGGLEGVFQAGINNLLLTQYILDVFGNHLEPGKPEERFFINEAEYILFGQVKDEGNYRRMQGSLTALRTGLNLVHIYTDQQKYQETLAAAAAILPGPAAPVVQFLIALAWAGAEAANDLKLLEKGKRVPLMKTSATWALSLGSVMGNAGGEVLSGGDGEKGLSYKDYLRMFLLLTGQEKKLLRVMDLIQINLSGAYDGSFRMKDCHCSLNFTAQVSRRSGFFGEEGTRTGVFNVCRSY